MQTRASCRQCVHGKYRSVREVLRFVLWDFLGVDEVHVKAISSLYCRRGPVCFWPYVSMRIEQKLEKLNVSFSQMVYQINRFLVVNFMILSRSKRDNLHVIENCTVKENGNRGWFTNIGSLLLQQRQIEHAMLKRYREEFCLRDSVVII